MLNRRILRIKAFKTLYMSSIVGRNDLIEGLKNLEISCEATRDLYLYMLAIISPITQEAAHRQEAAKLKFNPSEDEANPNTKFVNNRLAQLLDNDIDFQKIISKKKLSWESYDILIKDLYNSIKEKEYFKKYMDSESSSLREDVSLFIKIFEEEFVEREDLEAILEEQSIFWTDDLAYSLTQVCKTLKSMVKTKYWQMPELYLSEEKRKEGQYLDSDREFIRKVFTNAYSGYEKYFETIVKEVPDWDKNRLFASDIALLILCMSEVETFTDIPAKVSLNEYVEISKFYCTPKSSKFINGLLHKLIIEKSI